MRFSVGLAACLAASTHALPKGRSVFQPREEVEQDDDDDSPSNATDTCAADKKTVDSWVDYEVGEWFIDMANEEDDYSGDIQETIQSWGFSEGLYKFHCEPMQNCEGNFDRSDCEKSDETAMVYFINYAITNFNNFMTSLSESVDRTAGIADGMAGSLVDDFADNPDKATIPSSPGVLTAGILGAIGALLTGPAAIAAGVGSGLATIAVGTIGNINEGNSVELEPKFDDFADVTEYLAKASETLQTSLGDYAKWVLTSVPEQDKDEDVYYAEDSSSLPNILKDGTFAEPVSVEQIPDNIYVSLFSGAVSLLWKEERAIVVKYPAGQKVIDDFPCDTDDLFPDNSWCDDDGNMYVLLQYPELGSYQPSPWDGDVKDGFKGLRGVDKLGDYRMSIETVVRGTENSYKLNDEKAYKEWDSETTIDYLLEDESNLENFSTFNLPFCDAGKLSYGQDELDEEVPLVRDDDCDEECELIYRLESRCYEFPWDHTEQFNWEDKKCEWMPEGCTICIPGRECVDRD